MSLSATTRCPCHPPRGFLEIDVFAHPRPIAKTWLLPSGIVAYSPLPFGENGFRQALPAMKTCYFPFRLLGSCPPDLERKDPDLLLTRSPNGVPNFHGGLFVDFGLLPFSQPGLRQIHAVLSVLPPSDCVNFNFFLAAVFVSRRNSFLLTSPESRQLHFIVCRGRVVQWFDGTASSQISPVFHAPPSSSSPFFVFVGLDYISPSALRAETPATSTIAPHFPFPRTQAVQASCFSAI